MRKGIKAIIVIVLLGMSKGYAQEFQLKKTFKQEPLSEVLGFIEDETGFRFAYSTTNISMDTKVSATLSDSTIKDVLDKILEGTGVEYQVVKKRVILKQSQKGQTVRGKVIDSYTQVPILGATVVIVDSEPLKGDASDANGNFRLENVRSGRYTFKASYLGYQDEIIPAVLVGTGQEVILKFEMEESLTELDEIFVGVNAAQPKPLNDMAQVSGRSFTVEETKRYPVGVGDPMRLASSFAGVVSTDDGTNDIVIRGNSPKGILWMLEGIEIPSPNHFSGEGTSSGGISMFSTQVISRSDFLTGAFPSQYGNATAGVFDIQLRNGNNEQRESTFQLGLLGVDMASEGPLGSSGGASYLFNYRYSTLSMLSVIGLPIEAEGERNIFQDLSFKVNVPTKKAGTFSLFGLGGLSSYRFKILNVTEEEVYNMGVVGLSNQYILNNSSVLKSTISWSGVNNIYNYIYNRPDSTTYRDESPFKKAYYRAAVSLDKKFNARHYVSSGVTASYLSYNFQSKLEIPQNEPPYREYEAFNDTGHSGSFQSFVTWKYKPHEKVTLVNGVHLMHFFLNKETVVEPRSNIRWQTNSKFGVFAGFGLHSRIESLDYYFANYIKEDGTSIDYNTDLGLTRASHYIAGFDLQITDRTYYKTEVYYQNIFNVPVLADGALPNSPTAGSFSTINISNGYIESNLVNGGRGWNYGVEMTVERKFADNFFFLVNGMLYESKYQGRDGITRNTRYNGNFGYNLMAGKEFITGKTRDNIFGMNLKMTHAGNKRYTPLDLELSREQGKEVPLADQVYAVRFPDYLRVDVQFNYRKNLRGRTVEWRLDIQNLTSHNNVLDIYFEPILGEAIMPEERIFIPVLSYRIEF